jgi:hypothetical protein
MNGKSKNHLAILTTNDCGSICQKSIAKLLGNDGQDIQIEGSRSLRGDQKSKIGTEKIALSQQGAAGEWLRQGAGVIFSNLV